MGRPEYVVLSLFFLSACFLAAGSTAIAGAAEKCGRSPYWGVAFALSLGSIVCLSRMLGDAIMTSLVLIALGMANSRSVRVQNASGLLVALAVLQKETAALAAAPLIYLALINRSRGRLLTLSLGALLVGAWWYYVAHNSEPAGTKFLAINFGLPGAGFISSAVDSLSQEKAISAKAKDVAFLGIHAAFIVLGLSRGLRSIAPFFRGTHQSPVGLSLFLFAMMATCLSSAVWSEPWSYSRTLLPVSGLLLLNEFDPGFERSDSDRRLPQLSSIGALTIAAALAGVAFLAKNLITGTP